MNNEELKTWIEMKKLRSKSLESSVWIPLYEESIQREGEIFKPGYKENVFFVRSLLLPMTQKEKAKSLCWDNLGSGNSREVYVNDEDNYVECDVYEDLYDQINGVYPVLDQSIYHNIPSVWHLNQDIVIALKLYREGDKWICPDEDYTEVAHLIRKEDGEPQKLEIKTEFLKDYLCARNMLLRLVIYINHDTYVDQKPNFDWKNDFETDILEDCRWEGRINETTDNGNPIGSSALIIHERRVDVDKDDDIPIMGEITDKSVELTQKTISVEGKKVVYRVEGEIWKNETIFPGKISTRIKGDEPQSYPLFKIDSQGTLKNSKELKDENRWLWFSPNVINVLLSKRDGSLTWHTKETGNISCSYSYNIHFGINELGLITIFAPDIYFLPIWQQNIWAGFNVAPEGGVSKELLMSQVDAEPAETQAPEDFLSIEYNRLNKSFVNLFNISLFRDQEEIKTLLNKINRFKSLTEDGFYVLAKDLTRITADAINTKEIQNLLSIPKGEKWGSLKTLQNFLIQKVNITEMNAKKIMAPLFGIYDLRQVDAHLGDANKQEPFTSIGINRTLPPLFRGTEMLCIFVTTLVVINHLINQNNNGKESV